MNTDEVKIIILPGWGGTSESWASFIEIARAKYSVECINLPCFGDEPCPNQVWGVKEYAEFVESKVSTGVGRIVLLGHSFGGQVAAYLAAQNQDLISLLILVAPAVFRPKNIVRRFIFGLLAKTGKFIFKISFFAKFSLKAKGVFYKAIDARDYANTNGIQQQIFKKIIREDLTPTAQKIFIPTLILWGTEDTYTPIKYATKLKGTIPASKLHIFKGGKHGLHRQMPDKLFAEIDKFISSHWPVCV